MKKMNKPKGYAYGSTVRKPMQAGGMATKKPQKLAMGTKKGGLKDVPATNTGLGKLPTDVRNRMGYKAYGGKMNKNMR